MKLRPPKNKSLNNHSKWYNIYGTVLRGGVNHLKKKAKSIMYWFIGMVVCVLILIGMFSKEYGSKGDFYGEWSFDGKPTYDVKVMSDGTINVVANGQIMYMNYNHTGYEDDINEDDTINNYEQGVSKVYFTISDKDKLQYHVVVGNQDNVVGTYKHIAGTGGGFFSSIFSFFKGAFKWIFALIIVLVILGWTYEVFAPNKKEEPKEAVK